MNDAAVDEVTQRLEAMLHKERREAIAYSLLTVLCTPAFVAMASLGAGVVALYIFRQSDYRADAVTIYTGMVFFLASMVAFVLVQSSDPLWEVQFSKVWLAGAGVFLLLVFLTYGTALRQHNPVLFGVLFAVAGLLVLGLIGQVRLADRVTQGSGTWYDIFVGVMAVCALVVAAYGELLSASWLWVPPKPHEIRIAARVLCRLAASPDEPLSTTTVEAHVATLLSRLKLVETSQQQLHLTRKGFDFILAATKE